MNWRDTMASENELSRIRMMEQRYEYENRMMDAISHGDLATAQNMTFAFSASVFEERTNNPLRNLQNYCIIMNTLCRKAAEAGGVHPLHLDRISSDYARQIETLRSVAVIPEFMQEMMKSYCRLVRTHTVKNYSPPVQKALLYVESHLSDDLHLQRVADVINISSGYLSALFRRETGQTLTDHINEKRMEQACHLLRTTNQQIQTVAQNCGFLDLHYFCRQFKKTTGLTPTAYRKQH